MLGDDYRLEYLPLFYDDLLKTVEYISSELNNPGAANRLIDSVEAAILERRPIAEAFEPFQSAKDRKYPYYRIYVDNFIILYVVIDKGEQGKVMEIRRLLYKGRKLDQIV